MDILIDWVSKKETFSHAAIKHKVLLKKRKVQEVQLFTELMTSADSARAQCSDK